jgi:hypothetical protein
MFRSPRTKFAASLVTVVAGGCSHETKPDPGTIASGAERGGGSGSAQVQIVSAPPADASGPVPTQRWHVYRADTRCIANVEVHCPPNVACNPPAPARMPCPPDAPQQFDVVTFDHAKTCEIADTKVVVTCPSYSYVDQTPPPKVDDTDAAPVALRTWYVQRDDNSCWVNHYHPPTHCPPNSRCNPPPPRRITIRCPPKNVEQIVETKPQHCELSIEPHGQKVACPE